MTSSTEKGFTLLEMLISVLLLSILLTAVYSTFSLSNRAMDGLNGDLLKLRECRMLLDTASRELESAFFRKDNRNSVFILEDRDSYGRDTSRFTFTGFSPLLPGLVQISYYAEEKDGVITVFKKIKSAYGSTDPKAVEVIEGVDGFTIEVRNSTSGRWLKTWNASESGGSPLCVRLTLNMKMKDRPLTFTETVLPKIGGQP